MSELVSLDLTPWQGSSSEDLGFDTPNVKVEPSRYENETGQQFNLLDIDARVDGVGPTILTTTSFDYRIDPLYTRRMSVLASHANARVIASELPGVTMDINDPFHTRGDYQTAMQTIMALTGNFDLLAAEQLKAIDSIANFEEGDEVQLFGESLGAYSVTAMTRVMAERKFFDKQLTVTRMDLIEPVNAYGNYSIWRHAKMLINNLATIEDERRQIYLAENTAIGHGEFGAFEKISPETKHIDQHVKRRQVVAIYAPGAGLRKGLHAALEDALHGMPSLQNANIVLSRGADSTVSFETDLQSAAHTIRESGGKAETTTFTPEGSETTPIGHHVLNSYGRLASFTRARQRSIELQNS